MASLILTDMAASISEFKANPMKVVASGEGLPVAVLNRNEPAFYCVPAKAYEAMMELIEDMELAELAKERADEESVRVSLDDLSISAQNPVLQCGDVSASAKPIRVAFAVV